VDALIKLGTVATDIFGVSGRAMLEALIAGRRDPKVLAELARGRLRVSTPPWWRPSPAASTTIMQSWRGCWGTRSTPSAARSTSSPPASSRRSPRSRPRSPQHQHPAWAATPQQPPTLGSSRRSQCLVTPTATVSTPETGELLVVPLPVVDRLDEVAGIGHHAAQVIIAEVGLDMGQFPTPAHLVSWARLSPRTIQSGTKHHAGATGKGNPYLKSVLREAATAAAKTDTFLGERYRRLVRRIGKRKALVAVARSILVIVWHLLADPTARFHDLGADYYACRIDQSRKTRNLVRQLEALGHKVTLQPAT
jgi:transposase